MHSHALESGTSCRSTYTPSTSGQATAWGISWDFERPMAPRRALTITLARRANAERVFPHPKHLHFPACALALPSPSAPVGLHADEWGVDEVLREEPRLEFARPDDVGDHKVIGAVIAEGRDAGRRVVRVVRVAKDGVFCISPLMPSMT